MAIIKYKFLGMCFGKKFECQNQLVGWGADFKIF